jgi:hypothetical protein
LYEDQRRILAKGLEIYSKMQRVLNDDPNDEVLWVREEDP